MLYIYRKIYEILIVNSLGGLMKWSKALINLEESF
jgi:hypothetical protein